ncbi:hypothetical protein OROGR_013261 [Orobanche gracilis]
MMTSWADAVENVATGPSDEAATSGGKEHHPSAHTKPAYVPPHLRNRPPASNPPPPSFGGPPLGNGKSAYGGSSGSQWANNSRFDYGRQGYVGGVRGGRGGWGGRDREVNPFGNDDVDVEVEPVFNEQENTGINFDAYEDIPVETSGDNVPPPVNTFAEIDLGEEVNKNVRRCKYVKPTPVQRHAMPISLAGRDLMACAQTGSGKTAAFCFPIICGIKRGHFAHRQRGVRTAFPLALILSPTRELSMQIHEEARKFAYETGVRVVVAYGGAPIHQQ